MNHPLQIREEAKNTFVEGAKENLGVNTMKIMLIAIGVTLIVLAIYVNNPLALAGILAWVILP